MPVLWKWGKHYWVLIYEFCSSKTLLELKCPKEKNPSTAAPRDEAAGSCAATVTPRGAKPQKHRPLSSQTQPTLHPHLWGSSAETGATDQISACFHTCCVSLTCPKKCLLMPVSQFWQAHMENSTSDYTQCSMHNCWMNRWRKESQPSFNIFWSKLLQRNYCKQEFQRSESTGPVKKN